jgi:hypothetical protein
MGFLTIASLVLSAGQSGMQFFQGQKQAKQAEQKLDELRRQEFTNLAQDVQVSMEAERMARAQAGEVLATSEEVARGRGIAGAMGVLGQGLQASQKLGMDALTRFIEKDYQGDLLRLQEEQRIRDLQEAREQQIISSLSAEAQAGRAMQYQAGFGLAQAGLSAGLAQEANLAEAGIDPQARREARREQRQARRAARREGRDFEGVDLSVPETNLPEVYTPDLTSDTATNIGGFNTSTSDLISGNYVRPSSGLFAVRPSTFELQQQQVQNYNKVLGIDPYEQAFFKDF